MSRHASLQKNKSTSNSRPARVISLLNAGKKKDKKHANTKELPLYNNERIFKAKKHDPL